MKKLTPDIIGGNTKQNFEDLKEFNEYMAKASDEAKKHSNNAVISAKHAHVFCKENDEHENKMEKLNTAAEEILSSEKNSRKFLKKIGLIEDETV